MEIDPLFSPLFSDKLDDKRYYQVYGGRGSGKSCTTAVAMVTKTYSKYKHRILYLRQIMTSSEDSTVADVRQAIEMLGKEDDFRFSKGVFTNKITGSTISFKGIRAQGSQTAKLKSLSGITTVVIEEAEELDSFDEFSKIDESIRMKGKPLKMILVYNPGSALTSWIHKEWFVKGKPNPDRFEDTEFIHSTYLDNLKNLNPTMVKRYEDLRLKNPIYYRQTILAEWTLEVANKVYEGWGETLNIVPDKMSRPWYGLDFGYGGKDHTAAVKIWMDGDVYYIKELFSKPKMSIDDIASHLKSRGVQYNDLIIADSAAPVLIDELRLRGYSKIRKARKGVNSVDQGITKLQGMSIVMVGDNPHLYNAYMTFAVDDKGKRPHEPDILAALRYALTYRRINRQGGETRGGGKVIKQSGYI